jgi:His-Xaa-Ser system protein HxsD
VFLDAVDADHIAVELRSRSESKANLETMVGEFANELLSQAWRQQITKQNRLIIEAVTAQAFRGANGFMPAPPPPLAELDDLDFTDEAFDDPLGISLSWEEKYGKDPVGPAIEGQPKGPPPKSDAGPPKRPTLGQPNQEEGNQDE